MNTSRQLVGRLLADFFNDPQVMASTNFIAISDIFLPQAGYESEARAGDFGERRERKRDS